MICNKQDIIQIYNQAYKLRCQFIENCKLMFYDYIYNTYDINKDYYKQILKCLTQLEYLKYKLENITNNNILYVQYLNDCCERCVLLLYNIQYIDEIVKQYYDIKNYNYIQYYDDLEIIIFNNY